MSLVLSSAVIVDDALGAPAVGTIDPQDKNDWIDFVEEGSAAEAALRNYLFPDTEITKQPKFDAMVEGVISNHAVMTGLWHGHQNQQIADAGLEILFRTATNVLAGKGEKALVVLSKLREICGAANVLTFPDLDSAAPALAKADIAFIDFYLNAGEEKDAAIARIRNAKESLNKPKLLFFMSSRASLEAQSEVKKEVGIKAAFFDVMNKASITPEFIGKKVTDKCDSFAANTALVEVAKALIKATNDALEEFQLECDELEVHDLRLLDLARLDAEGESLPEYLTWLFSETLAAKTRRNALPLALRESIKTDDVGFTGQIQQGEVLFSFFSEVVFGPPAPPQAKVRFGELLKKVDGGRHYLVLTPACDLQRCEPSKAVLCVAADATVFDGFKSLAEKKLYGKLDDGKLCHLHWIEKNQKKEYTLLEWQADEVRTFTVAELQSAGFTREALMNEIYAHEVKEEVLRKLGRVGTQIDPSATIALSARLQWKKDEQPRAQDVPEGQFVAALLTYTQYVENGSTKSGQAVVLSDEFRSWAKQKILDSFGQEEVPVKVLNCIKAIETKPKFIFKSGFSVTEQDLLVKALKLSDINVISKGLVEVDLIFPEPKAGS